MTHKTALIMVDLQNDFCEGGSLAIPGGQDIIPLANQLQPYFDIVVATKDWHPQDHISFAVNHHNGKVGQTIVVGGLPQILWPVHCVQNTKGADFHPALNLERVNKIFHKGIDKNLDSYSAFFDNAHLRSTGLGEYLQENQVNDIYLMGLATDYCVKYSSLDAMKFGFNVAIIADACRGVDLKAGDSDQAFEVMRKADIDITCAKLFTLQDLPVK